MGRIVLVRHGQASFGTADYDRLSSLGARQSARVGRALAKRYGTPDHVVVGRMRRHRETAQHACRAAGWHHVPTVDAGWDEFDHTAVFARHTSLTVRPTVDVRAVQQALDLALERWTAGSPESPVDEDYPAFQRRVADALDRLADAASAGTVAVFTSAGVIAAAATALLSGTAAQWAHLNRVGVNTASSVVAVGRSGMSLVTFNDHAHLPTGWLTYR